MKKTHIHAARSTTKSWYILEKFVSCETMMQMMPNRNSDEPGACFVGKNENTDELILVALSSIKVGDPWNPNNTILGSAGEHFASAWLRDE